ncbi:phage tail tube protein [Limosilactobacillus mucosae]|uniref:phage tail tube protein n=1 Tax=Limosilactobacillus mucosae TaxID=97478 RepID=UPI00088A3111|nr:phage tail tube protein [Limosilactobacillus mucosae]SDN54520.1 phage major tail protein, TP901-1 family [Limosilactobacillus mucosae]SEL10622.1 phage major tail protein, TP901-1 family [Limosilactobacillus mucosae]SFK23726.1 phage major tail protein, TP901-1 family [Limosilactobacillus mucosae]
MANDLEQIQGVNVVVYARKLAEAAKVAGQLIPYQTSLSIDPQRDSDKKKTKSGTVTTTSSLETDFKFEFVNNWSKIADQLLDSIFDNEEMEFWAVNRQRKNSEGQYYALYLRGKVTEDSNDNDPDDVSSRETTITVDYGPVRGWVTLSEEQEAELAYIFRGVGAIEGTPKNDGTDGAGKAWNKETDAGQGVSDN